MKKAARKGLTLDRVTIRDLSSRDLAQIVGGLVVYPNTTVCPLSTAACPGSYIETRCNCPPPTMRGTLCD